MYLCYASFVPFMHRNLSPVIRFVLSFLQVPEYLLYTIIVYMCVGTFKTDSIFNPDYDSSGQWRFARNDSRYLRVVKKV